MTEAIAILSLSAGYSISLNAFQMRISGTYPHGAIFRETGNLEVNVVHVAELIIQSK